VGQSAGHDLDSYQRSTISDAEGKMANLNVSDVRVFVPARDFELSKAFYTALGWTLKWEGENLAVLELGGHRFYLSHHYSRESVENFRIHITVEDARAWYEHIAGIIGRQAFEGARVDPPKQEPYGALVTYAFDPSGVLLDFAQWSSRPS
jgi:catechol 2,3-dioxygenase-like lactoylglutathione lyase family enzyme